MTTGRTKTGKALERRVAQAYRDMGVRKVERDVELEGHQIDVYVELETADRGLQRIAVEAKDYTKPVGIKIVTEFSAVVDHLRRERRIDRGVIVSAAGFSRQARNAAEKQGIRLLEPADLDAMVTGPRPVPEPTAEATRAGWCLEHPYPMPPNFTGRAAERQMLNDWLEGKLERRKLTGCQEREPAPPLLVLRALGGFGKSALAWHWLTHDVEPVDWPRVVWWGFYDEREFDAFLRRVLEYLGVDARELGPRQQADALLADVQRRGTLLILDGFERALRAYGTMEAAYQGDDVARQEDPAQRDCVSPIAEHFLRSLCVFPDVRSKVLMTTRLLPRVLEQHGDLLQGCREKELRQMQAADAIAFFRAQDVSGTRAEIERVCARYGFHPLALCLLAGLIVTDLQTPGDIRAAERLDVTGDLKARRHHVLEQAYSNLTPERQELLSRIACFRGAVAYDALRALAGEDGDGDLDAALRDLVARGLLHHDRDGRRYDLHPIVRRYAYGRLTREQRKAAHGRVRAYFAALPEPEQVQRLEDLAPVMELYHHTVRAGQYDEAWDLFYARINKPTYFQFGAYDLRIELLSALFPGGEPFSPSGHAGQPLLKEESEQRWTVAALANSYGHGGQPGRAVPLYEEHNEICERLGDKGSQAVGLGSLADAAQVPIGALRDADANLRRRIELSREIEEGWDEAIGHCGLGRLLAYRGLWVESKEELAAALAMFERQGQVQSQAVTWADRALRALLLSRASALQGEEGAEPPSVHIDAAQAAARQGLELAEETARTLYPHPRDYVRAFWVLGAAQREKGDLDAADRHLTEALTRCRSINLVECEADVLLDLARLRAAQAQREEALGFASEALWITERSGYVLQGADVHLFLARMALKDGEQEKALEHAQKARQLATCDGPPDYTYKVAYDEAGALLAQLGQTAEL